MTDRRYIVQRVLTNEFLEWDLPIGDVAPEWELSGPGGLTGTISPDIGQLRTDDGRLLLEEWGSLIYEEVDGQIRWGGIVVSSGFDGPDWKIEAAGLSTYPHGMVFDDEFTGVQVDPADVVRMIWAHLQGYPNGSLGVAVVGSTPVRIGTDAEDVQFETGASENVKFTAGPYTLQWWDTPDCGTEIGNLASDAPFDWVERHYWDDGDVIRHEITIAYPRAGRRRDDLAFVQGENISKVVTPSVDGDDYANEIVGIGAGEGQGALRRTAAVVDGRLRRTHVFAGKAISSVTRMDTAIARELQERQNALDISSIEVRDHENAPFGSWVVGDDIRVQATVPWLGDVDLWCRIVSWQRTSDSTATLRLARSDSFTYGG